MTRKVIGVIGGMGPLATAVFMETLTRLTPGARDQDHFHVIVDSDPSVPDRTAFLLGRGEDPRPALVRVARRLESAGCELLVMPCNTAHAFADAITGAVSIRLVDWIETAADAAASRAPRSVGVLATDGTLLAGLYQRALGSRGIPAIVPDASAQVDVMDAIYGPTGVKADPSSGRARRCLERAASALAARGAGLLLLGCTELAIAFPATDPAWPLPTIDPAEPVALRVIALAGGSSPGSASRSASR